MSDQTCKTYKLYTEWNRPDRAPPVIEVAGLLPRIYANRAGHAIHIAAGMVKNRERDVCCWELVDEATGQAVYSSHCKADRR